MTGGESDDSEKDQEDGEEAALGRSFIADTPDEDPRFEATSTDTSDGNEDDSDED